MYQERTLPRRPYLGVRTGAPPDGVYAPPEGGVYVAEVLGGGAAMRAGVRAGDFIVRVDGEAPKDARGLLALVRGRVRDPRPSLGPHSSSVRDPRSRLGPHSSSVRDPRSRLGPHSSSVRDPVVFWVHRAGERVELTGSVTALPVERFDGGTVELGEVRVGPHRLRTLVNVPAGASGRLPSILHLQGLRGVSCDLPLQPEHPLRRLVEGWTCAGFIVVRVERSGVGDSEGPEPSRTDLGVELDGYAAALEHLIARPDVDPRRIYLFGQSLGGMVAPLIADQSIAGVMVFGTSPRRWHDTVMQTSERQRRMKGLDAARVRAEMELWSELHALVCREGWTPSRVFEARPHLRALRSRDCDGETLYGRHVALFQQLDALDLAAAWSAVGRARVPVLVLHGAFDWVCSREESEAIARAVGPAATFVDLAGIGHDLLAHDSLERSFGHAREGLWDGSVVGATVRWLRIARTPDRREGPGMDDGIARTPDRREGPGMDDGIASTNETVQTVTSSQPPGKTQP
jgi:pimeloyl-ACP methyl ester carboxylesterase